jgi:hypothetical protein
MQPAATTLAPVSAAAVDQHHVGAVGVGADLPAAGIEACGQLLGIDLVAGAAEGEKGDTAGGRGNRHPAKVTGPATHGRPPLGRHRKFRSH